MQFKIIADENIQKRYRIDVHYDDDVSYLWDDIQSLLDENNITIFSNLKSYKLADNEQSYNGDPDELREQGYHLRPIYAYIHSGISLSLSRSGQFSDQFDSGLAGVAAVEGKFTPEQEKALEAYVQEYNDLESSNYYRYAIYDENDEYVDGCGGFTGYPEEEVAESMMETIDPSYGITKNNVIWALNHIRS